MRNMALELHREIAVWNACARLTIKWYFFSICLLMVENYIPVYMRACTCKHTHIHIQKVWLSAWEHRLTGKWYGLIHTYKPLCQPMNSFFFSLQTSDILIRSNLRTFDCLCITSSTSLTHSRSSNHRRAVDHACNSWSIGHYDRYYLRKFVKSVRADHVQI